MFAVNGFGFAGRGQNTGIAFVSLKDWADRPGEENKVEAITMRATRAFSQIEDAMVFAFNLPAIVELGTATGFDFQLIPPGWPWSRKKTDSGATSCLQKQRSTEDVDQRTSKRSGRYPAV